MISYYCYLNNDTGKYYFYNTEAGVSQNEFPINGKIYTADKALVYSPGDPLPQMFEGRLVKRPETIPAAPQPVQQQIQPTAQTTPQTEQPAAQNAERNTAQATTATNQESADNSSYEQPSAPVSMGYGARRSVEFASPVSGFLVNATPLPL